MNKNAVIAAAVVLIIAVGSYLFIYQNNDASQQPVQQATTETTTDTSTQYSPDDVATHTSADDCWTIVDDNVYDITPYVARHPGGDEILRACGQDGSTLFNERETRDGTEVGSGLPHSSNARGQLDDFQIGVID